MKILNTLCQYLEFDLKILIEKRYSAFERQLKYLKTQNKNYLIILYSNSWTDERLKVIFALNSFYQLVLGPLSSSALNISNTGLGRDIPIKYGKSITFNQARNRQIIKAEERFNSIIAELNIPHFVLGMNSANDIIYNIWKDMSNEE